MDTLTQTDMEIPRREPVEANPFDVYDAPSRSAIALDPKSMDLIVRTIYGEVSPRRSEGFEPVAHVIRNRLESGKYGQTGADVVLSKNQFEPWMRPDARSRMLSLPQNHPTYQQIASDVARVFGGNAPDVTQGATHFFGPASQAALGRAPPRWAAGDPLLDSGGHLFYNPERQRGSPLAMASRFASDTPVVPESAMPGVISRGPVSSLEGPAPGGASAGGVTASVGAPSAANPFDVFGPAPAAAAEPIEGDVPLPTARPANLGKDIGYGGAIKAGATQGATLGFGDELAGAAAVGRKHVSNPSSDPDYPNFLAPIVGMAKLAYEKYKGAPSEETWKTYTDARDEARAAYKQAKEQYPGTTMASEFVGGAAVPLPGATWGAAGRGLAPLGKRMIGGAVQGTIAGGISGAGEAESLSDAPSAMATGAGIGAGVGSTLPVATGATGALLTGAYRLAKGAVAPTRVAAERIAEAERKAAMGSAEGRIAPTDISSGLAPEAMVIDRLGQPGADLARSAANISEVAKGNLRTGLYERAKDQANRFTEFLKTQNHYPDAAAQEKAIAREQKDITGPMYQGVMKQGEKGVVSPELLRLAGSPDIQAAAAKAMPELQGRGILEGFRAPRTNPLTRNENGTVSMTLDKNGNQIVPDLRFWDATKKKLDEEIGKLSGKEGTGPRIEYLTGLKNALVTEVDKMMPAYKNARGVAENFFGQRNALDAGRAFVNANHSLPEATAAFKSMSATQQQLFRDGFVSNLMDKIRSFPDRQNIWNKIIESPQAREKMEMVLGPQKFRQIELMGRLEGLMERSKEAVTGNSSTADQMLKNGLATAMGAGAGYGLGGGDLSVTGLAGAGLGIARSKIDKRVADRIATMLLSKDQGTVDAAVKRVANNEQLMGIMRNALSASEKSGIGLGARNMADEQNGGI